MEPQKLSASQLRRLKHFAKLGFSDAEHLKEWARIILNKSPPPRHQIHMVNLLADDAERERVGLTFNRSAEVAMGIRWQAVERLNLRFLGDMLNMDDQINDDLNKILKNTRDFIMSKSQLLAMQSKIEQVGGLAMHLNFYETILRKKLKSLQKTFEFLQNCAEHLGLKDAKNFVDRYQVLTDIYQEMIIDNEEKVNTLDKLTEYSSNLMEGEVKRNITFYNDVSSLRDRLRKLRDENLEQKLLLMRRMEVASEMELSGYKIRNSIYEIYSLVMEKRDLVPFDLDSEAQIETIGKFLQRQIDIVEMVDEEMKRAKPSKSPRGTGPLNRFKKKSSSEGTVERNSRPSTEESQRVGKTSIEIENEIREFSDQLKKDRAEKGRKSVVEEVTNIQRESIRTSKEIHAERRGSAVVLKLHSGESSNEIVSTSGDRSTITTTSTKISTKSASYEWEEARKQSLAKSSETQSNSNVNKCFMLRRQVVKRHSENQLQTRTRGKPWVSTDTDGSIEVSKKKQRKYLSQTRKCSRPSLSKSEQDAKTKVFSGIPLAKRDISVTECRPLNNSGPLLTKKQSWQSTESNSRRNNVRQDNQIVLPKLIYSAGRGEGQRSPCWASNQGNHDKSHPESLPNVRGAGSQLKHVTFDPNWRRPSRTSTWGTADDHLTRHASLDQLSRTTGINSTTKKGASWTQIGSICEGRRRFRENGLPMLADIFLQSHTRRLSSDSTSMDDMEKKSHLP